MHRAPTAHHLVGGLAVQHPKGLSSSSSLTIGEDKYPATHADAFSNGLVPVLNIDDSSSSVSLSATPT